MYCKRLLHKTYFSVLISWFFIFCLLCFSTYRKVASSRLSRLVAHLRIFRLFMKGKFDAYVLWPLAKRVQNWIVDRSTARDFTVSKVFWPSHQVFCILETVITEGSPFHILVSLNPRKMLLHKNFGHQCKQILLRKLLSCFLPLG